MKILALDISSKTGYSVFQDGHLTDYGQVRVEIENFNVNDYPEKAPGYPFNLMSSSKRMSELIIELERTHDPDLVVIENTVRGKNRHTQRFLEFIHCHVLGSLRSRREQIKYLDPSEWRSVLSIRLSKDDKKNNSNVSRGLKRGRIGKKHLSVRYANQKFGMALKLKDNDTADAICLGWASCLKFGNATNADWKG